MNTILYNFTDNINNNLLIAKNINELKNLITNNIKIDDNFINNKNKYIRSIIGNDIELVSKNIINQIIK